MALATQGAAVQKCLEGCPATAGMVPPAREVCRAARLRASCHMTWSCHPSPAAIQPSPHSLAPCPPHPCLCSHLSLWTCFTAGHQGATVDEDDHKLQVQSRLHRVRDTRDKMTSLWSVFMPRVEAEHQGQSPCTQGEKQARPRGSRGMGTHAWR